ncbi:MAG: yhjQ [Nitrospira sp.]|nr:yhjQ [Nitrospira sp.]
MMDGSTQGSAHSLGRHIEDCIQACMACAHICNVCESDMVGMAQQAPEDLTTRCIRLCRECADICFLSAQWMGRGSVFAVRMCALCAELCDLCAGLCEEHAPYHALCADCAKECRRCAALCHKMVAESVPNPSAVSA